MKCWYHGREDCKSDLCEHEYFVALRPHNPEAHVTKEYLGVLVKSALDPHTHAECEALGCSLLPAAPEPFTLADDPLLAAYTRAVERRVRAEKAQRTSLRATDDELEAEIKRACPYRINEDSLFTHADMRTMALAVAKFVRERG